VTAVGERSSIRELMLAVYGTAPDEAELEWWLERNPLGPAIVSVADGEGATTLSLFRLLLSGEERLGAFIAHAVTVPAARGRGVFSRLQLENEARAAEAGASVVLGFTTEPATRVLLGRHGWTELARPRVWVRPRLVRRAPPLAPPPPFRDEDARALARGDTHFVKDAVYLDWRYRDSPRAYGRVDTHGGFAVVGLGRRGGAVCELAGGARVLRAAVRALEARLVFALPGRDRRATFLAAGFLPTPWRLHLVGKRLDQDAPLPRDWCLELGDVDFF
jgi:GNAT superfamily N-acetyltransferase